MCDRTKIELNLFLSIDSYFFFSMGWKANHICLNIAIAFIGCLAYGLVNFHKVSTSSVGELLQNYMHISAESLNLFSSLFLVSYGIMQPITGILSDTLEPGYIICIFATLTSIGSTILAFSPNFILSAFARCLNGIGSAPVFVCFLKVFSVLFSQKWYYFAVSLLFTSGAVGSLIAQAPLSTTLTSFHWSWWFISAYVLAAIISFFSALVIRGKRTPEEYNKKKRKNNSNPRIIRKSPRNAENQNTHDNAHDNANNLTTPLDPEANSNTSLEDDENSISFSSSSTNPMITLTDSNSITQNLENFSDSDSDGAENNVRMKEVTFCEFTSQTYKHLLTSSSFWKLILIFVPEQIVFLPFSTYWCIPYLHSVFRVTNFTASCISMMLFAPLIVIAPLATYLHCHFKPKKVVFIILFATDMAMFIIMMLLEHNKPEFIAWLLFIGYGCATSFIQIFSLFLVLDSSPIEMAATAVSLFYFLPNILSCITQNLTLQFLQLVDGGIFTIYSQKAYSLGYFLFNVILLGISLLSVLFLNISTLSSIKNKSTVTPLLENE